MGGLGCTSTCYLYPSLFLILFFSSINHHFHYFPFPYHKNPTLSLPKNSTFSFSQNSTLSLPNNSKVFLPNHSKLSLPLNSTLLSNHTQTSNDLCLRNRLCNASTNSSESTHHVIRVSYIPAFTKMIMTFLVFGSTNF